MREVALWKLRKRDRAAIQQINLEGTKTDEATELRRAQVCLEAIFPDAKVAPHPLGALWAFKVTAVPFIGQPDSVPKTSAARRKFFIAVIERAMWQGGA